MKNIFFLLSIVFILSGCETVEEFQDRQRDECIGVFAGRCYTSVLEYCDSHSNKSDWDGSRTKEQRDDYSYCVQINSGMFNK